MSQINNLKGSTDVSHYENATLDPIVPKGDRPTDKTEHLSTIQISSVRPAEKSSRGWSAGRVAACILTAGISELLRLAWRGILSCCSSARPAPSVEARASSAPANGRPAAAPNADKENEPLIKALKTGGGELPKAHQEAFDSLLTDLRGQYGEKYIPKGITLNDLLKRIPLSVDANTHRDVFMGVKNAKQVVSPEDLKNLVRRHFQPALNKMILCDMAEDFVRDKGGIGGLDMGDFMTSQMTAKGMGQKVAACGSLADVQTLFQDMDLAKTLTESRAALNDIVSELQGIYGKDALPDTLEDVLKLGNTVDKENLATKINAQYKVSSSPISAEGLKSFAGNYLRVNAQQSYIAKAVEQQAREMGVPVTARSVTTLAMAIIADEANRTAINDARDPQDLAQAVRNAVQGVLQQQKTEVEKAYGAYADQLKPELQPLLRTYIEGLSFAPADAARSRAAVKLVADYLKSWKNFSGGEEEQQQINENFRKALDADLKSLEPTKKDPTGYTSNIYDTLIHDANRSVFVINGTTIDSDSKTSAPQLVGKIKDLLPDPQDQRFLSKLINQRLSGNMTVLNRSGMMPDEQTLASEIPGTGSIPIMPNGQVNFLKDIHRIPNTFHVTISDDRKTAEVTATQTQGMSYMDNKSYNGGVPDFGAVRYTFNIALNLSAHEKGQGVTGFTLGQEFLTLDEAQHQNAWNPSAKA